jgi:hypothetical protein
VKDSSDGPKAKDRDDDDDDSVSSLGSDKRRVFEAASKALNSSRLVIFVSQGSRPSFEGLP